MYLAGRGRSLAGATNRNLQRVRMSWPVISQPMLKQWLGEPLLKIMKPAVLCYYCTVSVTGVVCVSDPEVAEMVTV
jgi:hypothetical protein